MILPNDLLLNFASQKDAPPVNKTWPITTFSLSRNLSIAKFLPCLSREKKQEILEVIASHFNHIEGFDEFLVLPLKDAPSWQKEFLIEHFLFPHDLTGNPEGEALIVNRSGNILAAINFRDHLILHAIDFTSEPEKALDQLVRLDSYLNEKLAFAFSPDFGFLTTNPRECGTGLKSQSFLHAPALVYSRELSEIIDEDTEVACSGILPGTPEYIGNIVVLSNKCSLGLTEEQILSSLRIWSSKIAVAEASAKKKHAEQNSGDLKNHILRALGLLTHSYQLDLQETLDALSWIQLGISLGWIQGSDNSSIWNPVFWQARRGHLALTKQPEDNKNLQKEVISQLRADVLKKLAEGLSANGF
ncbi:ATP:guanido phosphotransferase [Chlamydia psittaci NJ1]|uniref:protein arginine kinase n=1 Tax=Chlamydia psittaci TaxID=83554 RepID=UPI00027E549D|nr:protein arginine kinase [Chlamydia psittaci]AFS27581.1 guanido phosphotransferase, C-terminal catalytic domain protein [Chlamydia psittaci NJ1]KPZ36448.1 ATP:guanido phosphotransferase [Chlamydia psittaci NJ1]